MKKQHFKLGIAPADQFFKTFRAYLVLQAPNTLPLCTLT